jgi:hypothetical protein
MRLLAAAALAAAALAPLAVSSPAAAQMPGEHRMGPVIEGTVLSLSAEGSVTAAPDQATVSLGVVTEGQTAEAAMRANATRMTGLVQALRRAGVAERDNVMGRVDIIQGTFAKAFGVMGGYIAGRAKIVDVVRSYASGFIFTTALPPVLAAGALASVRHLRQSQLERDHHQAVVARLKARAKNAGLPLLDNPSHILPIIIGDAVKCKAASDLLLERHNIYVQPINYPTVARGAERLRITPTPLHTIAMQDALVEGLKEVCVELAII